MEKEDKLMEEAAPLISELGADLTKGKDGNI